jgi:hypothetical protein
MLSFFLFLQHFSADFDISADALRADLDSRAGAGLGNP